MESSQQLIILNLANPIPNSVLKAISCSHGTDEQQQANDGDFDVSRHLYFIASGDNY